jgi:hypothetical protein
MVDIESKVIGFIAQRRGTFNLLCDGDSAIVAGSEKKMLAYISDSPNEKVSDYEIKKARFGHILYCLKLHASYSFDGESYNRFHPLAIAEGMNLPEIINYEGTEPGKLSLTQVRWE